MSALTDYLDFYKTLNTLPNRMTQHDRDFLVSEKLIQHYPINNYIDFYQSQNNLALTDYLIPEPFCGDVSNSRIYFINYNPKLSGEEYIEQSNDPSYKNMLINVLNQKLDPKYPFFSLNPAYKNKVAYGWWTGKLDQCDKKKSLLQSIANKTGKKFGDVKSEFSRLFCNIEIVPYHSKHFDADATWITKLDATKETLNFIHGHLIPEAQAGRILLLIRSGIDTISKNSGYETIPTCSNIKIIDLNMNVSFGCTTELGKAIYDYVTDNNLI